MIIPTTTRMNLKLKLIPCVYSVSLLVLLGCFLVFPCSSRADTTENLLTNPGFETGDGTGWTQGGTGAITSMCGKDGTYCAQSGPASAGGTLSQNIDLFDAMTQGEINNGFTLNYGGNVGSHSSNAIVPTCAYVNSQSDCRDTFSISVDIKDSSGTVLQTFEHVYEEITWTGFQDFTFEQSIASNDYTSAIATLEFYGIDSGYYAGTYGPSFDNAYLTSTFTSQAVLDAITATINQAVDAVTEISSGSSQTLTVSVTDSASSQVENFNVEVTSNSAGTQEISIQPSVEIAEIQEIPQMDISTDPVQTSETQVEQVEAQVEAQMETIESTPEPTAESESESTSETETAASSESNTNEKENGSGGDSKGNGNGDKKSKSELTEKDDKKELKQQIATRIITKIIAKLDNSAQSQATQLALMNAIGAAYKDTVSLVDHQNWYQSVDVYQQPQLIDPAASMFVGAQNGLMDQLVGMQYGAGN